MVNANSITTDEYVDDLISSLRTRNQMMNQTAGMCRTKYIKRYGDYLGEKLWYNDLSSITTIEHELIVKLGSYKTDQIKAEIAQEMYSEKETKESPETSPDNV